MKKELITKLSIFGLNNYEAKLWMALLSRGAATAGELSDISNVPRSRTYDVLESLEKKGFIILKLGKPIKYLAVPPLEVLDRVRSSVFETAEQQAKIFDNLKTSDLLQELSGLYDNGITSVEPNDITRAIKGRSNIHSALSTAIKNAKHSVTILTTEQGFERKVKALKLALHQAKRNGASIRIAAPINKKTSMALKELHPAIQVRSLNEVPGRFCVIDEKESILMPLTEEEASPEYDYAVWLTSPYFGASLNKLFETAWKQGETKDKTEQVLVAQV